MDVVAHLTVGVDGASWGDGFACGIFLLLGL